MPAGHPRAGPPEQVEERPEQVEEQTGADTLIEELGHALGMTPAEVAALGLSPAEIRSLLSGFTEETVVVGSRARPRSATESAVPVDVLSATDLLGRGAGDLKDQLRTVIPSFNANTQPIQGASTVVRPAMLRNLAPDHTLVLINGKRRHRASVLEWHGGNGVAYGSQGPDISVIPAIALRQVEVLRDGAAAQYGSDAIAGVMNFQLKDAASGGAVEVNTGVYGAGDGEGYQFAGNIGLPLGAAGFTNLSLEYGSSNQTDRTAPRADAVALIAAGNTHVRSEHPQVWGDPDIDDDLRMFGNFGYALPSGVQLYAHVPDPAALQQVRDDPNCFSFQEMFPGGFTPQMGGTATDASLAGGVRGVTAGGFNWDLSGSVGMHGSDLFIYDTVNASLGPASPTSFDVGSNRQRELNLSFDVSYAVTDRVNLAAGAEWRDEQFRTVEGDRAGWLVGPYAEQRFMAGANGFFGYGPRHAGTWSRYNVAAYGDLEVTGAENAWTLGGAVRVENFEDFGTTTNGKLSGRFGFVRGASAPGSGRRPRASRTGSTSRAGSTRPSATSSTTPSFRPSQRWRNSAADCRSGRSSRSTTPPASSSTPAPSRSRPTTSASTSPNGSGSRATSSSRTGRSPIWWRAGSTPRRACGTSASSPTPLPRSRRASTSFRPSRRSRSAATPSSAPSSTTPTPG